MPYNDRLKILKLPILTYRRYRKDVIEMYNILTNKYDNSIIPIIELNEFIKTRGNSLKLNILESKNDLRKYSFCARVPKIWSTLSNSVINSKNINSFKINLDSFWANKEVKYNY